MRRLGLVGGALVLVEILAQGCGGAGLAGGGLTGRWTGTWIITEQEPALVFEVTLVLVQDKEGNLQGTALLNNTKSATASTIPVLGQVTDSSVVLVLGNIVPLPIHLEGTVAGGSTLNGKSRAPGGEYPVGGTWVLERVTGD